MVEGRPSCCAKREASGALSVPASYDFKPSTSEIGRRWSSAVGGSFFMGSADKRFPDDGEGPVREVTLDPFQIACHTVSNLQFGDFVSDTGYSTDAERYGWSFVFEGLLTEVRKREQMTRAAETPWWIQMPGAYWAQPEGADSTVLDRLDHPAIHISWNDAKAYCFWSGTRLPTEAEWEMAARGGLDQAKYAWGDELQPEGEHRCNIWQGEFQCRGKRMGVVRGLFLAAVSRENFGPESVECRTGAQPLLAGRIVSLSRVLLQPVSCRRARQQHAR
jgi:sulfatase modifying factor 1